MQFLECSSKTLVKRFTFRVSCYLKNMKSFKGIFPDFFYFSGAPILWNTPKWLLLRFYIINKKGSTIDPLWISYARDYWNVLLSVNLTFLCLCKTGRPINLNSNSLSKIG